jgi:hypothetical protein
LLAEHSLAAANRTSVVFIVPWVPKVFSAAAVWRYFNPVITVRVEHCLSAVSVRPEEMYFVA